MAAVVTLDKHAAPLRAGDLWTAVSTKGMGQPVKIRRVSTNQVYFRAFGRGADESQTFKLPQDAFRVRYAPLSLAEDRRKAMERADRTEVRREPLGDPVPVNEAVEAAVEAVAAETSAPPSALVDPVQRGGRARLLTGEQAREVYLLAREANHAERLELAKAYSTSETAVYGILSGVRYPWATEDLRREFPPIRGKSGSKGPRKPKPASVEIPHAKLTGEQAREIHHLMQQAARGGSARGVYRREVAARFGVLPQTVNDIERGKAYRWAIEHPKPAPEPAVVVEAVKPQEEGIPVQITTPPTVIAPAQVAQQPEQQLLTDLADALDFLLEYAGRPLPKYLMLDLPSLAKLSERARALGGAR